MGGTDIIMVTRDLGCRDSFCHGGDSGIGDNKFGNKLGVGGEYNIPYEVYLGKARRQKW